MIFRVGAFGDDQPPPAGAALVEKMSRWRLLLLCARTVALLPIALAVRVVQHYLR